MKLTEAAHKVADHIANEPILHLVGTVGGVLTWLFTYVATGFDPTTHQQELAGLATGIAYLLAFGARQYVTPVKNVPVVVPAVAAPVAETNPAALVYDFPDLTK
jgi:uncharacterized membrane-anchored protein